MEVPFFTNAKDPWNILEQSPRWLCFFGNAGALTGEAAAEEIKIFIAVAFPLPHVRPAGNIWKSLPENSLTESVNFDLADALMVAPFKP